MPITKLPGVSSDVAAYALSVAASIQKDFVNDNAYPRGGVFRQVVYQASTPSAGLYSLWFTDPIAFVIAYDLKTILWSSFIHEMGHNFTLNSPADFYFGGRIDGDANAIYSETMAQIFQHATIHEMTRRYRELGLSEDLMTDIADDALATCSGLAGGYANYLSNGRNFTSWNDSRTAQDETLRTFLTLAYVFLREGAADPDGYRLPVKRMMEFLQLWNAAWQNSYGQQTNSPGAETFRSTMMVAAISHGLQRDMRTVFRDLKFPIDDIAWNSMNGANLDTQPSTTTLNAPGDGGQFHIDVRPADSGASWTARSEQSWVSLESGTARRGAATLVLTVEANPSLEARTTRVSIGRQSVEIRQQAAAPRVLSGNGVVNGASFAPGMVAGSWVTIYGSGLAATTRAWRADDIVNDQLPTMLDGVQVKIGGKPAFVYFISPAQINVQAPEGTAGGAVPVEVTRESQSSAVVMAEFKTTAPALFSYAAGSLLFPAAVHLDGVVVGDPALAPGTRRASGGMRLLLYGTGFEPSVAGVVVRTAVPSSRPVRVLVGDKEAVVEYAGLVGPGLFQINVKLPDLLPGTHALTLDVAGVRSPPGPVLPVE